MLSEYEKKAIKYLSQFEGNYVKIVLNLITKLQKENEEKDKIIEKKDNIINLMTDSFAEEGFYNEHCQTLIDSEICPNDCNKCVKQYFEKLAKEKE